MLNLAIETAFDGVAVLLFARSILAWLEAQVKRATVFSALSEGAAGIKVAGAHQGLFADDPSDVVHHGHAALKAGAIGEGEVAADLALVVIGNERRWHHRQA